MEMMEEHGVEENMVTKIKGKTELSSKIRGVSLGVGQVSSRGVTYESHF